MDYRKRPLNPPSVRVRISRGRARRMQVSAAWGVSHALAAPRPSRRCTDLEGVVREERTERSPHVNDDWQDTVGRKPEIRPAAGCWRRRRLLEAFGAIHRPHITP